MFDAIGLDRRHQDLIAAARRQFEQAVHHVIPTGGSSNAEPLGRVTRPGTRPALPGYEILREVHRGGQGVVYEAVQESTRRTVAVKVLREGPFAGETDRLRFEREVSILAQLQHRNIIGILDRGSASGSHYLVMDFIEGRPLDRYAREHGLDLNARLLLFAEVCDAVTAAHLRGVIHRDLKPGNIFVDATGEPRILDFGLAKLSEIDMDSVHGATQTGQFIGSLPWASPEQAQGLHGEVDIRSDVYSLGVILYQLLTNRLPYSTVGGMEQALAAIRGAEPVRPRSIAPEVDDDLETIVLKCLSKEPTRRYQSVGELARDVRHYLADEAIEAKRDSAGYVLRRMLRRHKLGVGVAFVFVVLTLAATVALSILYRAKTAEFLRAENERTQAVAASESAEKAAAKADAVTNFLGTMLGAADPSAPGRDGHQVKVVDVMKRASTDAATQFVDQPEVEVAVRSALGEAYFGLGLFAEAEAEFRASLQIARTHWGEEHDETVSALLNLSTMLWVQGKLEEGESMARQGLEIRLRQYGDFHRSSIDALTNLAAILNARGRPEEGLLLNQRALAAAQSVMGFEHERTLQLENNLAFSLDKAGRLEEAEILYRSCLERRIASSGAEDPNTIITMQSFANCLRTLGKLDEAEPLARKVVEVRKRILPPGHASQGDAAQVLGRVLFDREDFEGAADLFREALEIHQAGLPPESWRISVTRCDLGRALTKLAQFVEAERTLMASHESLSRTAGDHPRQERDLLKALVDLYQTWDAAEPGTGMAEKMAEWQARLEDAETATTQPT